MTTVRKTITLTDKQDEWVKSQIANGDYTNESEYFRDLIRREQDKFHNLKAAVEKGMASGSRWPRPLSRPVPGLTLSHLLPDQVRYDWVLVVICLHKVELIAHFVG